MEEASREGMAGGVGWGAEEACGAQQATLSCARPVIREGRWAEGRGAGLTLGRKTTSRDKDPNLRGKMTLGAT